MAIKLKKLIKAIYKEISFPIRLWYHKKRYFSFKYYIMRNASLYERIRANYLALERDYDPKKKSAVIFFCRNLGMTIDFYRYSNLDEHNDVTELICTYTKEYFQVTQVMKK